MDSTICLVLLFSGLLFFSGCLSENDCIPPYMQNSQGDCCLDEDSNGICDSEESKKIVVVLKEEKNCQDGIRNFGEVDIDCGGPCPACPGCNDGVINQEEEGVDCGGPCPACPTCSDGILDQGEEEVDCGGPCKPCPSCTDGIINQGELGLDCGGPCAPCPASENCSDGVKNQNEIGVDCGGICPLCACKKETLVLTSTKQDGFIRDSDDPPDGFGDQVTTGTYLQVGDLAVIRDKVALEDDRYVSVVSFPIKGIRGYMEDAVLELYMYASAGIPLAINVEHIVCGGEISGGDYSVLALNESIGILVVENDSKRDYYNLDVTDQINFDLKEGRDYSCYRLKVSDELVEEINNSKSDRRVFYGFEGQYPPRLTYILHPCVACYTNRDCEISAGGSAQYVCKNKVVYKRFDAFSCVNPGKEESFCNRRQNLEVLDSCAKDESCRDGEDRCYPLNCFDGTRVQNESFDQSQKGNISTRAEEGVDCGGFCRPCHCLNGIRDESEIDVDCGGLCPVCLSSGDEPILTLKAPRNITYNSRMVELDYSFNKKAEWCRYSLNEGGNNSVSGKTQLGVLPGTSNLKLVCMDVQGNLLEKEVSFTVMPLETRSCRYDKVSYPYLSAWNEIFYFMDDHAFLETRGVCNKSIFEFLVTRSDSARHSMGPIDVSAVLSDQDLSTGSLKRLNYECLSSGNLEASYLYLGAGISPEKIKIFKTVFYFTKTRDLEFSNAFWRFYAYEVGGNGVNENIFIDVDYLPKASSCEIGDKPLFFQEIDLSPLLPELVESNMTSIELRASLYTNLIGAGIELVEAETYMG
ncbi:MAG: hypothetical protein ABH950_04985 [Candidatus Altiarchaeota archaeon]